MIGDVTNDDLLNILDVVLLISVVLEETILEDDCIINAADITQDYMINIQDIVALVSFILADL